VLVQQAYLEDAVVGAVVGPITYGPVTTRQMVQWTAAADDYHEIHYDKEYALAQGLPDVIVQGPLKTALMGRLLLALVGPKGWIRRMNCRYLGLDLPKTVLTVTATVTAVRREQGEVDLDLLVVNEKAERTAAGAATVTLPRRATGIEAGH